MVGSVPIIVLHQGRSANRVFQYLAALALSQYIPGSRVCGYDLDIFGLASSAPDFKDPCGGLLVHAGHELNLPRIADHVKTGLFQYIQLKCWGMRLEYLPNPRSVRDFLFPAGSSPPPRLRDDEILVHIRGGQEFVQSPHPDYPLLPMSYYQAAVSRSGKKPVFFGETADCEYMRLVIRHFPSGRIIPPRDPLTDFLQIATANDIVCSVSSFCWLAAWIASPEARITLPVCGLFDPEQRGDVDLLPHQDERFTFLRVPVPFWSGTSRQIKALGIDHHVTELSRCCIVALKADVASQRLKAAGVESASFSQRRDRSLGSRVRRTAAQACSLLRAPV